MIDFIQVGDYKTGTSWLQKYFYPVHPEINYLGGPFKNDELEHLLHVLIDSRDLDFNGAQLRKDILRLLPDGRSQKVSGICREVFSGSNYISCENAKQNAERLFEVFGNVKIIFIIREQLDMIRSIYSQYLKIGGSLKIDNFIFDPIVSRGLIERLKWHKQIQMYYDLFGQENVHIGLYEEFKYDKQTFLTKLCQFLVIKNIEIKENEKIVNKSLTVFGETFARIGNRFFRSNFNNSNKNTISPKIIELLTSKKKLNYIINDTERRIKIQTILFTFRLLFAGY